MEKICTLYVEDTVSQRPSNGGKDCFFWHIEEIFFCGYTGNGFNFFDKACCIDVISDVVTQHLRNKKEIANLCILIQN